MDTPDKAPLPSDEVSIEILSDAKEFGHLVIVVCPKCHKFCTVVRLESPCPNCGYFGGWK